MKENFLPSKTFSDKKQTMFLNITPHFIESGRFMARDFMFSFSRTKTDFSLLLDNSGHVVGRFLTPEKIVVERGELTDKEMRYLRRIARIVCRK